MIAFLCSNLSDGYHIVQADMPAARIERTTMRVYLNPQSKTPSGVIVNSPDRLAGLELSGYVILTDVRSDLVEVAHRGTRKPLYWHIRDREED